MYVYNINWSAVLKFHSSRYVAHVYEAMICWQLCEDQMAFVISDAIYIDKAWTNMANYPVYCISLSQTAFCQAT
jgi:hypothetical protein